MSLSLFRRASPVVASPVSVTSPLLFPFASIGLIAAAPPPQPPPGAPPSFISGTSSLRECTVCKMTLTGILSWEQHVTGKRHLRTLAAAAKTAPAESPAVRWSCPPCGIHIDAPSSVLTPVAGERHRRSIDLLRHGGRLDDVARLFPRLRAAMAAVHRAGDDEAQFGRLIRQARIDADEDVSRDDDTSDNDSGNHAGKNNDVAEEDGARAAAVSAPAVASGAASSAPDVGRRAGRKRRRSDGGGPATARPGPSGRDAAVVHSDEDVCRLEGGNGLRQDGGASRDGSVATSRNGGAVSSGMSG